MVAEVLAMKNGVVTRLTIAFGWLGKVSSEKKSLPCCMIMYVITLCIYQRHRDMSQVMESVMEAAARQLV